MCSFMVDGDIIVCAVSTVNCEESADGGDPSTSALEKVGNASDHFYKRGKSV